MKEYMVPSMEIIYMEEDDTVRTSGDVAPTLGGTDSGGNTGSGGFY